MAETRMDIQGFPVRGSGNSKEPSIDLLPADLEKLAEWPRSSLTC